RQRDETVVSAEDAAADPVGRFALQSVCRCLPLRAAAEVRGKDGDRTNEQRTRQAETHVADAEQEHGRTDEAILQIVAVRARGAKKKRSEQRAEPARGEEQSDSERAGAEDFLAEDAEHGYDSRAEAVAAFRRQQ